jgi:hypothetical protein
MTGQGMTGQGMTGQGMTGQGITGQGITEPFSSLTPCETTRRTLAGYAH